MLITTERLDQILSVTVTVNKQGIQLELIAQEIPEEILPAFIEKLADYVFSCLYRGAPWRSGKLAMSVTKTVEDSTARIGPTVSYAPFVSLGTAPHEILPKIASVLAFPGSSLGGTVFSKSVHHQVH